MAKITLFIGNQALNPIEVGSIDELKTKARRLGATHVVSRQDFKKNRNSNEYPIDAIPDGYLVDGKQIQLLVRKSEPSPESS